MINEQDKAFLMAYLDGELDASQKAEFERRLDDDDELKAELDAFRNLTDELDHMEFSEPTDAELHRFCSGVYNRIERGLGWFILLGGLILLAAYGGFALIQDFIRNPGIALAAKIGVCGLLAGAMLLFVSLLRERLAVRRFDKYSREIRR